MKLRACCRVSRSWWWCARCAMTTAAGASPTASGAGRRSRPSTQPRTVSVIASDASMPADRDAIRRADRRRSRRARRPRTRPGRPPYLDVDVGPGLGTDGYVARPRVDVQLDRCEAPPAITWVAAGTVDQHDGRRRQPIGSTSLQPRPIRPPRGVSCRSTSSCPRATASPGSAVACDRRCPASSASSASSASPAEPDPTAAPALPRSAAQMPPRAI